MKLFSFSNHTQGVKSAQAVFTFLFLMPQIIFCSVQVAAQGASGSSVCPGVNNISWQKSFGGSGNERASAIQQTTDGGYVIAGSSLSTDGDLTATRGKTDYWIVKTGSNGELQWQKSYGGTADEVAYSIQETFDGGYIVAGTSSSLNGDVTGNHGNTDYWVIKLDVNGVLQWQKTYGGNGPDVAYSIRQALDGGYVIAGYTKSSSGDVTNHHGNGDFWIVKINSTGILQWQKAYGGSAYDFANSIEQTSDGGYITAGYSRSGDGEVTSNYGEEDCWILKLDENGNLIWQRAYGGTGGEGVNSIKQTTDGGYIAAGVTHSNNVDVSGNHGVHDYWILRLDSLGSVKWKNCYGGSRLDNGYDVKQTAEGGFIVAGSSSSDDQQVSGNKGLRDYSIIKLDEAGIIQWSKQMGGSGDDDAYNIQITDDGGYIIAGTSLSGNGDVTGNHGNSDFWIVKIMPPPSQLYYADTDADGMGDSSSSIFACSLPSGYVTNNLDCNDNSNAVHPGGTEVCNGMDDDCNGLTDDGIDANTYYTDADGDKYGSSTDPGALFCSVPLAGYSVNNSDCNDADSSLHPAAVELCNEMDDNCDGEIDEECNTHIFYADTDSDAYGDQNNFILLSTGTPPEGYVSDSTDCNDMDATIHPGATELCNETDDNCDGSIDNEITFITYFKDVDLDGFGDNSDPGISLCLAPGNGFANNNTDCNDNNAAVNPNASELCNTIDDNCNAQIDEGAVNADVTPSGIVSVCSGSTITLNATSNPSFTYQWKKKGAKIAGATNSSYVAKIAAVYTVIVSSGTCSATSTGTTLQVNSVPAATINPGGTTTVCPEVPVILNANAGTAFTYQWQKNNLNILNATSINYTASEKGAYKVIVTNDVGCSKTSTSTTVSNYKLPSVKITNAGNLNICSTGSVTLSAKTGTGNTYQWFKDNIAITGATATTYLATQAGSYNYQVTSSDGCTASSANKVVKGCRLGESDINELPVISIYPNPSNGNFLIEMNMKDSWNGIAKIELINLVGKTISIEEAPVTEGELHYKVTMKKEFPTAVYFVKVSTDDRVFLNRIIYQK